MCSEFFSIFSNPWLQWRVVFNHQQPVVSGITRVLLAILHRERFQLWRKSHSRCTTWQVAHLKWLEAHNTLSGPIANETIRNSNSWKNNYYSVQGVERNDLLRSKGAGNAVEIQQAQQRNKSFLCEWEFCNNFRTPQAQEVFHYSHGHCQDFCKGNNKACCCDLNGKIREQAQKNNSETTSLLPLILCCTCIKKFEIVILKRKLCSNRLSQMWIEEQHHSRANMFDVLLWFLLKKSQLNCCISRQICGTLL